MTNIGATTLTITNVVASAQFGDNADTCIGASLAAGATCTLNVFFLPTASGPQTGSLTFTDNAGGTPGATQTVPLGGTGNSGIPGFNASPLSLAFGNQIVGTTSTPLSVLVTNPGSAPVTITNVVISGPANPGDFTISSDTCVGATAIPPGGNCTVQVTFTPTGGASRTANLVFTDNAPTSPQTVPLGGNGIVPPATSILTPTVATLTVSSVGGSTTQTFTVQNNPTSTGNLGFGTPVATTTNAVFSVTGGTCTPATSLAVGASCTIIVTFTSTSTTTATGTLNVNDTSGGLPANTETSALSGVVSTTPPPPTCGTGTNITSPRITPSALAFGSVSVGITSNPQVVMVENMDPTHQLCVSGITTSLPLVFGILTPPTSCLNTPLNFLQSCQIDVTFTPGAKIGYFQSLSITDNAASSPQVVT
ncbi:MAG: choice-of-anchor D domain-containing protein, partial [Acidimicrobiales bacterium]